MSTTSVFQLRKITHFINHKGLHVLPRGGTDSWQRINHGIELQQQKMWVSLLEPSCTSTQSIFGCLGSMQKPMTASRLVLNRALKLSQIPSRVLLHKEEGEEAMAFLVESCGEMVVSPESHKQVPAPFLTKTYTLVDDPSTNHIVSWEKTPPHLLCGDLQRRSFFRVQGFRKIVADRWEFANEFFRKGGRNLLCQIQRRKTHQIPQLYQHQQHISSHTAFDSQEEISSWNEPPMLPPTGDANTFISALSEDNERLRRNNSYLLSELTHMKKLYHEIISFIQTHVNPRPCRLLEFDPSENPIVSHPQLHFSTTDSGKLTQDLNDTVRLFGVPLCTRKMN
ncbi:hypothetical protein HPP92_006584 [Vanilla planifolia]|uniref:HSF-type DNA-binding domain-containing protein n=1 Tax=Vanilla planifolia TaxID=51239 RepID=A0A835RK60_VANPL|nr:hypothetical protein HPP92_006584 [Vanilla planifolia]